MIEKGKRKKGRKETKSPGWSWSWSAWKGDGRSKVTTPGTFGTRLGGEDYGCGRPMQPRKELFLLGPWLVFAELPCEIHLHKVGEKNKNSFYQQVVVQADGLNFVLHSASTYNK